MTAIEAVAADGFHVVTAEDADGGLRLSLIGRVDDNSLDLRDVVVAALRSAPPRVEIDLRALDAIDLEWASFLLACHRVAEMLGVEYRVSSARGEVAAVLAHVRDIASTEDRPGR